MMAGKPSPQVLTTTWHGLIKPALNEKRALTAGGQGSYRSPRESIWVSYAKHTTRYNELTEPVGGLVVNIVASTWANKPMRRSPGVRGEPGLRSLRSWIGGVWGLGLWGMPIHLWPQLATT